MSKSASRSRSASRTRSRANTRSTSRSRDRDRSRSATSTSRDRKRARSGSTTASASASGSGSASKKSKREKRISNPTDELTKDQRTIFVSQLVMKATASDIRRYMRKTCRARVNDVILLRDKRTGRHKGCAYVELADLKDVSRVVMEYSEQVPDFQRFPIRMKASSASEVADSILVPGVGGAVPTGAVTDAALLGLGLGLGSGVPKRTEAQKVYIGNIDQNVTQSQLYAIFSQFGALDRVLLQLDPGTGLSKGFAFLSFQCVKVAHLALTSLAGQLLAGKQMKTGWANQNSSVIGLEEVTSTEYPDDSLARIEKANVVFTQLNGTGFSQTAGILQVPGMASKLLNAQANAPGATPAQIDALAEEAVNLALGQPPSAMVASLPLPASLRDDIPNDPKMVQGKELTKNILVRNMYDKDEESEEGWAEDIKLDFQEEGGKHGKITSVVVMSKEVGGKIYASFESIEGAAACALNLAGRWFDKRQLQVEFVSDASFMAVSRS